MADVRLRYGKCQHVTVDITIDKETRTYVLMQDDLKAGIVDKDEQFDAVLKNVRTNVKLQNEADMAKIATTISLKEFVV
jgi:hypothetical protein